MSLMNEALKLNNIKLQIKNLNIQFDTFFNATSKWINS